MDFGIGYFPTHDGTSPGNLAKMLEERGQTSLLFAEHPHIPMQDGGPKNQQGGPLPQRYWHCYDLFVAATAATAATSRLRVGSGICLVTERDPIVTAKEVASIDHLGGGRFEFGVGAGWNRQELRNHGTDPRTRMALMKERVEAIKAIWASDEASYHGQFVSFDRILSYPKPAQTPHPPILVGGDGPTVLDRVLAFGDGWIPSYRREGDLLGRIDELRQRADRPLQVQVMAVPADPAVFEQLQRSGVHRVTTWLPSGPPAVIEPVLRDWENAIGHFTGEL